MRYFIILSAILAISSPVTFADKASNIDVKFAKVGDARDCKPSIERFNISPTMLVNEYDLDNDGQKDYQIISYKNGTKVYESYDVNHDGNYDDFYVYIDGILTNREVDSNYDGYIDLWVYLYKGSFIRGYERDENYDFKIDKVKAY